MSPGTVKSRWQCSCSILSKQAEKWLQLLLGNQVPRCESESKVKTKCSWLSRQRDTERQQFILNNKTFTVYLKTGESRRVHQINLFNVLLSSYASNWVREKKG